jgi:hypothetical protein
MRAYLDTQVIDGIQNFRLSVDGIVAAIDPRITSFPYSMAHLWEAEAFQSDSEDKRNQFIDDRLTALECISMLEYAMHYPKLDTVLFEQHHPRDIYETIDMTVGIAKPAIKLLTSLIPEAQKDMYREMLGVEARKLNNYHPSEVIGRLSSKLVNWGTDLSFVELIEAGVANHPDGKSFGLYHRIAGIFELLDMMGYWKDKYSSTSNYARAWDASHAYHASFCDYLVSDDKRMRYKSLVVYDLCGIETKVVSSSGNRD